MSRIGFQVIKVPADVTVEVSDATVNVKGGKGENSWRLPAGISVKVEGSEITVSRAEDTKQLRAMHGTARSLIANMIEGVHNGFQKELEISGVGYKAQVQGTTITLNVGFANAIEYEAPDGVSFECKDGVNVKVSGVDKQLVGLASARIRNFCKAEPYKGKGIKYKGEKIRRKVGKTVA